MLDQSPANKRLCVIPKGSGYGVIRPCYKGYKIGMLFSDNADIVGRIFNALLGDVSLDEEFFSIARKSIRRRCGSRENI
jgi:hypothetical protein